MFYHIVFIILYLSVARSLEVESCIQDGIHGICTNVKNCLAAIQAIRNKKKPQLCGYDGIDPVVCCAGTIAVITPTSSPVATPQPVVAIKEETSTKYVEIMYDHLITSPYKCYPLHPDYAPAKTGQKAWDKCIEYQEKLVFPCENSPLRPGSVARQNYCTHAAEELIVGGPVSKDAFPNIVWLGFGEDTESAQWLCSGTLLSEWFILTAAQCTYSREYGSVTYAILGNSKRPDNAKSNVYKIKTIIRHPEYKPPSKYNDIALLQTKTKMSLGQYAVPACLDVGKEPKYDRAFTAQWVTLAYGGNSTEILLKKMLSKFSDHVCSEKFPKTRAMQHGFDSNTQICYGDYSSAKDTCHDDIGGPLQLNNKFAYCMYTVVGVASVGTGCGEPGDPAMYTKVEPYVPWIENIVWP